MWASKFYENKTLVPLTQKPVSTDIVASQLYFAIRKTEHLFVLSLLEQSSEYQNSADLIGYIDKLWKNQDIQGLKAIYDFMALNPQFAISV